MAKGIGLIARHPRGLMRKAVLLVLLLGFGLLWSSAANADLFIKFTGIDGESQDRDHRGWSDISSVAWGVSVTAPSGGGGAGRPVFNDLSWNQVVDTSLPPLFTDIVTGRRITKVLVDFTTTVNERELTYFEMEFRNVSLTSLDLSGDSNGDATLAGSFAYGFIKMTYRELEPDGSLGPAISAQYNVQTRTSAAAAGRLAALYGLGLEEPTLAAAIPIPGSLLLLGTGLIGLIGLRRKFWR